jgi:tryptophan synthase alpha chain
MSRIKTALDGLKAQGRKALIPYVMAGYPFADITPDLMHGMVAAGVDGVLVVDYPPEECVDFAAKLRERQMDLIFLLAPTSTDERMAQVDKVASGYVYYVSLKGVTGAGTQDTGAVEAMLPRIRQHVSLPVGVGFGIRDAATARAVSRVADAVVIGSRIIQLIEPQPRTQVVETASAFLREIRAALDA